MYVDIFRPFITLSLQMPMLDLQTKICDVRVSLTAESRKFRVDFHCVGAKTLMFSRRRRSLAFVSLLPFFLITLDACKLYNHLVSYTRLNYFHKWDLCGILWTLPDVIQALLPIVDSEGSLLTAGWAQISTRTVGLSLYPQLQPVERHWERDKRIDV